jgi:antitoxin PrlF
MSFATLTSKGQATIPLAIRTAARLRTGDRLHFTVMADGTIVLRVKNRSIGEIAIRAPSRRRVSIAKMNR